MFRVIRRHRYVGSSDVQYILYISYRSVFYFIVHCVISTLHITLLFLKSKFVAYRISYRNFQWKDPMVLSKILKNTIQWCFICWHRLEGRKNVIYEMDK